MDYMATMMLLMMMIGNISYSTDIHHFYDDDDGGGDYCYSFSGGNNFEHVLYVYIQTTPAHEWISKKITEST